MLCIIPARAGSKRFPGKNVAPFKGKPLVSLAIESAIESDQFNDILVTSNDPRVIDLASEYPVHIHARQDDLAEDTTRVIEVVKFLLNEHPVGKGQDEVMLLFATSPLRTVEDIKEAVNVYRSGHDSLLTVTEYGAPPQFALEKRGSTLGAFWSADTLRLRTQKQSLKKLYYPNYAIQLAKRDVIFKYDSFFGDDCGWLEIPPERAVDVDTPMDLKWAEFLQTAGHEA